jgi:ubiquitin carboxyl-terminal hydrolase 16/45
MYAILGQTKAEVNPKKVKMTGKVQAESCPSVVGVDHANKLPRYESRSSDAQGYAIRGIPNRGNTCYMSAVLQCLFVLGKLRERMLALDRPKSRLAKVLKKLFLEASAAGDLLNPNEVLECVRKDCAPQFGVGAMEDSHDLLTALRELWNQGEENDSWQNDAPTVMDSIFGFVMARTLSCKKCGHLSPPVPYPFQDLSLGFPSNGHPTKSAALSQTNESPRSRNREIVVQLFPADVQRNLEKIQTVPASGYSDVIGSEVAVEETQKPLEVGEFMIAPALIKMP